MRQLADIVPPLLRWYRDNKRDLPWRRDRDPYRVWISEIMLQQTRIEAVRIKYAAFLQALPTVAALAAAPEEQLLKLWEGLGYYSRAKNLQKAAKMIQNEYGGRFPDNAAALSRLPGVGAYTAGAVASICFGERVPAVDGNVLRVIARVTAGTDNVLEEATKKKVTEQLRAVIPAEAGDFNEALMELGETVCLPNEPPRCERCPLRDKCLATAKGLTDSIPVRKKEVKRRAEHKNVFVILSPDGETALEKRADKGLLSGLYQLPNADGDVTPEQFLRDCDLEPEEVRRLGEKKHVFTHIDWYMCGYCVRVKRKNDRFIWATKQQLQEEFALPTAFLKFLKPHPIKPHGLTGTPE